MAKAGILDKSLHSLADSKHTPQHSALMQNSIMLVDDEHLPFAIISPDTILQNANGNKVAYQYDNSGEHLFRVGAGRLVVQFVSDGQYAFTMQRSIDGLNFDNFASPFSESVSSGSLTATTDLLASGEFVKIIATKTSGSYYINVLGI